MALDHYVSQVHLKQFLRASDRQLLLATRKSDLAEFTPRPKDVCRVEDGSTNEFLRENRIVEEFLKSIEPAYEPCLERLKSGELDHQSRMVFAGFLAYVQTYSPAAVRMFDPMTRTMLEQTVEGLEKAGKIKPFDHPSLPDWHGKSVKQLTDEGKLKLNIDLKMPQALATTQLINIQESLANSDITILRSKSPRHFLTSDFPSIIFGHYQNKYAQRLLPICPNIALVFHTESSSENKEFLRSRTKEIGARTVEKINDEIIKSAEEMVFSTHKYQWLAAKVKKYRNFRVENVVEKIGPYTINQQKTVETLPNLTGQ